MVRRFAFLVACLLLPVIAQPVTAQVGVTSVAVGEPRGTPPAQAERVLRVGVDVFANEHITTRTADRAHLVFLDGSALTVGPDSDLVIDRFVYDPSNRLGDLAMTATRGVFRLVGGAISKTTGVTISTPAATATIRGGIMTIAIGPDGSVTATFVFGTSLTLSNARGSATAVRPGSQIAVPANGAPQPPVLLPPKSFEAFMAVFETVLAGGTSPVPGDVTLLAQLNALVLRPERVDWLVVLQGLAAQGITIANANRPTGSPPTRPAPACFIRPGIPC